MIYTDCPVLENEQYLIRRAVSEDSADLLKVYSDKNALPFFNSDNCHGDNFYYPTEEIMKKRIEYWNYEYDNRGFVRFSVIDKNLNEAIGTIELFKRSSEDYFNCCGILRLDLRSDYEIQTKIYQILSLVTKPAFDWFECSFIATKAPGYAIERISALEQFGYKKSAEKLMGHDGTVYGDYWCAFK